MKTKLDTTEAVLEWADDAYDSEEFTAEYRETAAYIAECVRLRVAFETLHRAHTAHCARTYAVTEGDLKTGECLLYLEDAIKGGKR